MLTCVAVALNIAPFASPKRIEARSITAAGTTPTVTEQPNGSSVSLPTIVTSPDRLEPAVQVADTGEPSADIPAAAAQSNANSDDAVVTFVGVWAPDAGTCSAREFREGTLPAVISNDGAWAGETFCMFTNKKQTETGWNVVAKCSNPRERWTANVRLTVKDNRLTWTSKRGAQAYTRCAPDVLMAAAR